MVPAQMELPIMVLEYKTLTDEEQAFDNMFHYYLFNKTGAKNVAEFYRQNGIKVKDSKVVFDSPEHRTMFLLRWLS